MKKNKPNNNTIICTILFMLYCVTHKAQEIQSAHVKTIPRIPITVEMENEMALDTTGKYKVGKPVKKELHTEPYYTADNKFENGKTSNSCRYSNQFNKAAIIPAKNTQIEKK